METPTSEASGRGLVVVVVVLLLLVVVADLMRPDSFLRELWADLFGPRAHFRDVLRAFRRGGPGSLKR